MKSLLDPQIVSILISTSVANKSKTSDSPINTPLSIHILFNIPEVELHDRVVISPYFFVEEAEASSTTGHLLHF